MIIRKILFITTLVSVIFCGGKVGTSIFRWAEIETGTRAVGMAGSQVASGNGVYAIPYNPATLGFVEKSQIFISKAQYLAGITHNTIAYGTKVSPSDYVGVHLYYLDSGSMQETNEDGLTGQNFKYTGLALRVAYAKQVTDRLKLGGNFKFLRESTTSADLTMSSIGFDIGSNFETGIAGMTLGMCISNFGPEGRYTGDGLDITDEDTEDTQKETQYYPMPLTFRVGLKNDVISANKENSFVYNPDHRLTLSIDAINPLDYELYASMGVEYGWNEMVFVRTGTHLGHDMAGFTFGAGVLWQNIAFDIAYADYGKLLSTWQAGISFKF